MIKLYLAQLFLFLTMSAFSQNIDIRILRSINSPKHQTTDNFFTFVSNSNDVVIVGVPACLGIVAFIKKDTLMFKNACVTVVASAINLGVTYVVKYSINRKRPFDVYPDITKKSTGGNASFPSGHTSGAFATATSLSLAYPKWYIVVPSFAWASTVAYSRLQLGVHYPSDVLGGAIVGMGSAFIAYKANKWLNNYYKKKYEHQ